MYFDSHAHLDDRRFDEDREVIFEDLKNHGVDLIMNIGCDLKSSLMEAACSGHGGAMLQSYDRLLQQAQAKPVQPQAQPVQAQPGKS